MHFNAVKITVPAVSSVRLYSFFLLQTHSTFVILEYVLYYYNFIKEKKKSNIATYCTMNGQDPKHLSGKVPEEFKK